MKDYSFGNFICALRTRLGLSQFQLGTLVGVSDKAVSKWENGTSRPRIAVCQKLADVLGLTLDELLACKYHTSANAENGVFAMKTKIWEDTEAKLNRIYGKNPSPRIIARYESEKHLIGSKDLIVHFSVLAKITERVRSKNSEVFYRGEIGNSFIAWLMGITDINPLEPHYYCPACKKVEFVHDVRDGWDLKEKPCQCGHMMIGNGHNLPFEKTLFSLDTSSIFDISVAEETIPELEEILHESYTGDMKAVRVSLSHVPSIMVRYLILDQNEHVPAVSLDYNEFHQKYGKHTQYSITPSNSVQYLTELSRLTNRTPSMIDFLSKEVISAFAEGRFPDRIKFSAHYDRYSLKTILQQLNPGNFTELAIAVGLFHSTCVWKENQEKLYLNGEICLKDLLVFREDVYDLVSAATRSFTHSGNGLELRVMENVRKGHYAFRGMPENEERLLKEIGISKLHIEIMKNTGYMFPKAHCISELQIELKLIWFWLHYTDLYNRVIAEDM